MKKQLLVIWEGLQLRATLAGIAFGACFPAFAFFVRSNPVYLFSIICTAPLVLGVFSYVLAATNQKAARSGSLARHLAEQVALQQQLDLERAKSAQNAKMASLGEMSAGIAHEINNPLSVINGSIPLLTKFRDDPAKFTAKLESMGRACERIERIVEGLRKFSRSSEGDAHERRSLKRIVTESLVLIGTKARWHSTPISSSVAEQLEIVCDEIEIEQVVVNLLSNAIDAVKDAPDRWVKVEGFEEQGQAILRVIDSGPGIPEEIEEKLFQPFFTTKPVGEGTGLGLSITKGILDRHGASISILRGLGNTCFELRFPLAPELSDSLTG